MNKDRNEKGQFVEGNNLGEGRPLKFPTPKDLENKCNEYFKWVDDNPLSKLEALRGGERAGEIIAIPTQRPYTLRGLCQFIKITVQGWHEYGKRDGFFYLTTYVREKIENQQIEGAMVGMFNPNLTARLQGLSDKTESKVKVEDVTLSPEERAKKIKELENKLGK